MTHHSFEPLLRAVDAEPLWCGNRADAAYRFMLVFDWGKTKVITVRRLSERWTIDGAEFKHSRIAPFEIDRRIKKRLADADAESLLAALDRANFWLLEPDAPPAMGYYEGPTWVIEGRDVYGYHLVRRYFKADPFKEAGRRFIKLSGLEDEANTPPQR